uniref:Odorant binding protein 8a n=1 Tax=Drosophila melanogaster TaxID=7227 RepID=E2D9F2_DROME|nr:odorant binding protein 8a [Drosophila melanogaster]ACY92731.1 odorant binding protein 8a [Drosophila melanogaster]ACY92732.1 odorant binding protein 8a [Drosophila melanogaster]ACY92733.1 odorant binding protein 8a [Drosophila melanogaster]ACY92764.1 odorant binding protein 8a [Drosophila melanogaster]
MMRRSQIGLLSRLLLLLVVVELTPPAIPVPMRSSPQSLALLRARDQCGRELTAAQRLQLDRMQFEDAAHVRHYLHCFWSRLQLWLDETGFQAQRIVQSFGGERRLNVEQALPAINGCNAKTSSRGSGAQTVVDWCFRAFVCVLATPVGEWYKRHMSDVINGNA